MTHALEMAQSENVTLRRELMAQERLPRSRQNRRKSKRIALKGKFVLSPNEVLEIAREIEANAARIKRRQQQRSRSVSIEVSEDELDMLEKISSDSESDCIVVATSTVDLKMMKPTMSARFPAVRVTARITLTLAIGSCSESTNT
jgi:hypothetical protein